MSHLKDVFSLNNCGLHIRQFVERASSSLDAGSRLLDAGAGNSPYRQLFSHCEYEATDICVRPQHDYQHVTFICDLTSVPVNNDRYDAILCTQVLEHVTDPQAVLAELYRILRPGGTVWLSTPLFFEEHEIPHDYFRYTQFGLKHLFESAGFAIEKVDWAGGYFGTLAYQLQLAWHYLPSRPCHVGGGLWGLMVVLMMLGVRPVIGALGLLFAKLDLQHKYTRRGHCIDYCVVASKR